jgi:hypothetical protein
VLKCFDGSWLSEMIQGLEDIVSRFSTAPNEGLIVGG